MNPKRFFQNTHPSSHTFGFKRGGSNPIHQKMLKRCFFLPKNSKKHASFTKKGERNAPFAKKKKDKETFLYPKKGKNDVPFNKKMQKSVFL